MSNAVNNAAQSSMDKVLAAIHKLGQATAAAIAEQAGIAYSTTTPKLRALEQAGHAERLRNDEGQTLWRVTGGGTTVVQGGRSAESISAGAGQATVNAARTDPHIDPPDKQPVVDGGDSGAPDGPRPDAADTAAPQPRVESQSGPLDHQQPAAADPTSPDDDDPAPTRQPATVSGSSAGKPKRPKGVLRGAVLTLLQNNPATAYKISEICKLLDQANSGAHKVSAGAVANALDKLVGEGAVKQVNERPATFQAQ
jgi:hypothetical protein